MENTCLNCKFADWNKTANGRLHPNKQGHCMFVWTPPPLPAAFYFHTPNMDAPKPNGGFIERHKPYINCPTFEIKA